MASWTLLCALVHSLVGTGRGHPRIFPTDLGAWNCPKCVGPVSLELRGKSWKTIPHHNPSPNKLYTWYSGVRRVLLATNKPRLTGADVWLREDVSTALESSASETLHCAWWRQAWMQLLNHGNPSHEALRAVLDLIRRLYNLWRSVVIDSAESWWPLCTLALGTH